MRQQHSVDDNFHVTTSGAFGPGDGTITIGTGEGATCPTAPFWLMPEGSNEQIEVTAVVSDSLTVTRGANGTTAASIASGTDLELVWVAAQVQELQNEITDLNAMLYEMGGGHDHVLRVYGEEPLKVVAQGTPNMTVSVSAGVGYVNSAMFRKAAASNTSAFSAPVTHPRIDVVQINKYGTISTVPGAEGATPSAPSVTAGNLKLAEVYCRVGMTSVQNTDDSTNGYITDARVY